MLHGRYSEDGAVLVTPFVSRWMAILLVVLGVILFPPNALAQEGRSRPLSDSSRSWASLAISAKATSRSSLAQQVATPKSQDAPKTELVSDAPRATSLQMPLIPEGFSVQEFGWLTAAYHPSLAAKMRVLLEEAEAVRAELTATLGRPVLGKVHLRVGRTAGEMEMLAPQGSGFPRYASGVAYSELGLVLLTATSRYPGERHVLAEVFRHELAHIALHDAVSRDRIPRWFNEGFAVHASGEASTSRISTLWTATLSGNLIPFTQLTRSFPADATTASVAYSQAADLVRFLLRQGEEHRFGALIERVASGQSFDEALADAYSTDMFTLEQRWRENVAKRYTFWPVIFGGSLIWIGALGLLVWGYLRRKSRAKIKLDRWAREEALEDVRRAWVQSVLARSRAVIESAVSMRASSDASFSADSERQPVQVIVSTLPTVEHDGKRHVLH
jgi:hypothetical protein